MNKVLTILSLVCSSAVAIDYESKMQAALDNFAAGSDGILSRAIEEGNKQGASTDTVEIDANGGIKSSSSTASLYADFGLDAVSKELDRIEKVYDETIDPLLREAFTELTAKNGNDSTTIAYSQLKEWKTMAEVFQLLGDNEVFDIWQEVTGAESKDGKQMTFPQFVTFDELLDKRLMAKADFLILTEGKGAGGGVSYDELWNVDAMSDYISEDDFLEFWQEATGRKTKKGVMNYEQFLVFWEIASEWLDIEYRMDNEGDDDEDEDSDDEDSNDEDSDDDDDDELFYDHNILFHYHGLPIRKDSDFYIADKDLPEDLKADLESTDKDIRKEAMARRRLDPEMWSEFSYWELHAYFACDKLFLSPRPLWTDQQWRDVRDFYHEFMKEDEKDEDSPEELHSYQFTAEEYDLSQNAIPFQSGEKGRGLQAVRDIQAGELVFKATNNTIVFNYGHTWRKLLFAINERYDDPGITCDMHVWSWVQDLYDGGPMKILMDLDSGSLLNEGRDEATWDPPNVQCGKPDATRCDMDYYAFRDIKKGDELLIDYREFAWLESWPAMGL